MLERFDDATVRQINKYFREIDSSQSWPIRGRFNATERAIRNVRKFRKESGFSYDGVAYAHLLENEISNIVNNTKNW